MVTGGWRNRIDRGTAGRRSGASAAQLVDRAGTGDQLAWNALVSEFGPMIWAVARAHRLSQPDAGDVAQATWLKLLEHLRDLHDPERVGAWLATTARRECLRVLRGAARYTPAGDDAFEAEPDDVRVDLELLVAERDAALWRSFERLRESDRLLLRLLMAEPRRPYEEIADMLGIPIGSIGPTRARALERLRRELAADESISLMAV
jgi:RNA polymerase sigma factor (sigma-70 family)